MLCYVLIASAYRFKHKTYMVHGICINLPLIWKLSSSICCALLVILLNLAGWYGQASQFSNSTRLRPFLSRYKCIRRSQKPLYSWESPTAYWIFLSHLQHNSREAAFVAHCFRRLVLLNVVSFIYYREPVLSSRDPFNEFKDKAFYFESLLSLLAPVQYSLQQKTKHRA